MWLGQLDLVPLPTTLNVKTINAPTVFQEYYRH